MLLSSRLRTLWGIRDPTSVVAQQLPEDIDSAACEGYYGLVVGVPVRSFLEVVVPVRPGSHHAGLCRQVEHVP